jgi:hypothetical protein
MGEDEEGTLARLMAHRRVLVELDIAEHRGRASSRSPLTVSGPRLVGSVTFPFTKTEITLLATGYRGWKSAFAAEYTGPLEPE